MASFLVFLSALFRDDADGGALQPRLLGGICGGGPARLYRRFVVSWNKTSEAQEHEPGLRSPPQSAARFSSGNVAGIIPPWTISTTKNCESNLQTSARLAWRMRWSTFPHTRKGAPNTYRRCSSPRKRSTAASAAPGQRTDCNPGGKRNLPARPQRR